MGATHSNAPHCCSPDERYFSVVRYVQHEAADATVKFAGTIEFCHSDKATKLEEPFLDYH